VESEKITLVRRLLRERERLGGEFLSLREIARYANVSRGTVDRVLKELPTLPCESHRTYANAGQADLVRRLVREGHLPGVDWLTVVEIAREAHVGIATIEKILKAISRPVPPKDTSPQDDERLLPFEAVEEYLCPECSAEAGYAVFVTSKPCVACSARAARANRPAGLNRVGH
jgi:DNA invertase Pin-like site-specific DNA recombinase